MFLKYIAILLLNVSLIFSVEHDYCSDKFPIVSDLSQEDCDKLGPNHYYKERNKDCFPGCVYVESINYECGECPPGYICPEDEESPTCRLVEETPCFKYHVNEPENIWYTSKEKPICLNDGTFAAKQCKGEETNGRCFCYNSMGRRIYGSAFSSKAANMTCACSRRRSEMEKDPDTNWFISLHCDEMGNYEPLQCNLGQCWCTEPETGDILSTVVPENMMTYLPCYDVKLNGDQYLRQCESHLHAIALAKKELTIHGTAQVNFMKLMCDPDGSYGTYKIINGQAFCTWKDNEIIGSFLNANADLTDFNCYCARDSIFQSLICDIDGSYLSNQVDQNGNGDYCVDKDGFQKSELEPSLSKNCSEFAEY